jgi:hypothetical protein
MSLFSKMEDKKIKPLLSGGWDGGMGKDIRKRYRRMNMVKLCTHV